MNVIEINKLAALAGHCAEVHTFVWKERREMRKSLALAQPLPPMQPQPSHTYHAPMAKSAQLRQLGVLLLNAPLYDSMHVATHKLLNKCD